MFFLYIYGGFLLFPSIIYTCDPIIMYPVIYFILSENCSYVKFCKSIRQYYNYERFVLQKHITELAALHCTPGWTRLWSGSGAGETRGRQSLSRSSRTHRTHKAGSPDCGAHGLSNGESDECGTARLIIWDCHPRSLEWRYWVHPDGRQPTISSNGGRGYAQQWKIPPRQTYCVGDQHWHSATDRGTLQADLIYSHTHSQVNCFMLCIYIFI
jgi:hypothetical protein